MFALMPPLLPSTACESVPVANMWKPQEKRCHQTTIMITTMTTATSHSTFGRRKNTRRWCRQHARASQFCVLTKSSLFTMFHILDGFGCTRRLVTQRKLRMVGNKQAVIISCCALQQAICRVITNRPQQHNAAKKKKKAGHNFCASAPERSVAGALNVKWHTCNKCRLSSCTYTIIAICSHTFKLANYETIEDLCCRQKWIHGQKYAVEHGFWNQVLRDSGVPGFCV